MILMPGHRRAQLRRRLHPPGKKDKKTRPFDRVFFCTKAAGRLLDRDRFAGAFASAGAAADAIGFIDFGSAVFHGDRVDGAGSDAGFAAGAFALIDFCSHCSTPCLGLG